MKTMYFFRLLRLSTRLNCIEYFNEKKNCLRLLVCQICDIFSDAKYILVIKVNSLLDIGFAFSNVWTDWQERENFTSVLKL